MKRLMIAFAAVAAAFAVHADATIANENFNGKSLDQLTAWSDLGDSTICGDAYSQSGTAAGIPEMNKIAETVPGDNLVIKTPFSTPTYFEFGSTNMTGVYFDSLVKFTACDEDATIPTGSNAKIMVWTKEIVDSSDVVTGTNLMVTAGFFGTEDALEPKIYNCGSIAKYDVALDGNDWCRLTIKSIASMVDAQSGTVPGFVVFVNGNVVAITGTGDALKIGLDGSAALAALTKVNKIWESSHELFPSMVSGEPTLSAIGFAGQGAVDNVEVYYGVEPTLADGETQFARDPEPVLATVNGVDCTSLEGINNAIAAASSGAAVVLADDVSGDLEFPSAVASTLELGAYTLGGGVSASGDGGCVVTISGTTGKIEGEVLIAREEVINFISGKIKVSTNPSFNDNVTVPSGYELKVVDGYYTVAEITEDGTVSKPWQIDTAAKLVQKLITDFGSLDAAHQNFVLTDNIDLAGADWDGPGESRSATGAFVGVFDGAGYTISNLTLARKEYNGFIGCMAGTAQLKNVTIQVVGFGSAGDASYGGAGAVGFSMGTDVLVENVTVKGQAAESILSGTQNIGGVGCRLEGKITLKNCTNELSISTTYSKIAGMCAIASSRDADGLITFDGCVNKGVVTTTDSGGADGCSGILGYIQSSKHVTIKNCENYGTISSPNTKAKVASIFSYPGGQVIDEISGNKANADIVGLATGSVDGLMFATVADGVATFVANSAAVAGANIKVMAAAAPGIVLANVGDTITVDKTLVPSFSITTTATDAYLAQSGNTYTVTAKTAPAITITGVSDVAVEYTAGMTLPTPSVTVEGGLEYTGAWDPSAITEPTAGTTNTYTYTVNVAATSTTLANTATATYKVFKAAAPAGFKVILTWSDENITNVNYSVDGAVGLVAYTSGTEILATESVQFFPNPKDWFKAQYDGVDGTGIYTEATNVVLTAVAIPQADPEDESKTVEQVADEAGVNVSVIENLTPGGSEASDKEKKLAFNKAMNWARSNNKSTAAVAALSFDASGNPNPEASPAVKQTTEAYLFNVADDAGVVETAKEGFKFEAIVPGTTPKATTTVTPNGTVTVQGKATLDAEWGSADVKSKFYRAVLTR